MKGGESLFLTCFSLFFP